MMNTPLLSRKQRVMLSLNINESDLSIPLTSASFEIPEELKETYPDWETWTMGKYVTLLTRILKSVEFASTYSMGTFRKNRYSLGTKPV